MTTKRMWWGPLIARRGIVTWRGHKFDIVARKDVRLHTCFYFCYAEPSPNKNRQSMYHDVLERKQNNGGNLRCSRSIQLPAALPMMTFRTEASYVSIAASQLLPVGPTHGTIRGFQAVCIVIHAYLYKGPPDRTSSKRDEHKALTRDSKFQVRRQILIRDLPTFNPKVVVHG